MFSCDYKIANHHYEIRCPIVFFFSFVNAMCFRCKSKSTLLGGGGIQRTSSYTCHNHSYIAEYTYKYAENVMNMLYGYFRLIFDHTLLITTNSFRWVVQFVCLLSSHQQPFTDCSFHLNVYISKFSADLTFNVDWFAPPIWIDHETR